MKNRPKGTNSTPTGDNPPRAHTPTRGGPGVASPRENALRAEAPPHEGVQEVDPIDYTWRTASVVRGTFVHGEILLLPKLLHHLNARLSGRPSCRWGNKSVRICLNPF